MVEQTPPFDFARNPHKAKRQWPPNFNTLSSKDQFRLERRYRRRAQLKYARPGWMAFTRLLQWVTGIGVLGYGVFFYDFETDREVFAGPRRWLRQTIDDTFGPKIKQSSPSDVRTAQPPNDPQSPKAS